MLKYSLNTIKKNTGQNKLNKNGLQKNTGKSGGIIFREGTHTQQRFRK